MNEVKLLNIGGVDQNIKDQYARDVIAPSENGLDSSTNLPVSSRHYDVGAYLIGQNRSYYEVIAEIDVGDEIIVGTNVRATTVSDEIIALKNQSAAAAIETVADTETTGLASQPYTKGSYFYWDYGLTKGLYKVINADISQGDAFVIGTNIQSTQVGDELVNLSINDSKIFNKMIADEGFNLFGEELFSSQTVDHVSFIKNADGSVQILTGQAPSSNIRINMGRLTLKAGITYYISDLIDGTSSNNYAIGELFARRVSDSAWLMGTSNNPNNPNHYTPSEDVDVYVGVAMNAGLTVNRTVYPMLKDIDINVPYIKHAKSNYDLTKYVEKTEKDSFTITAGTRLYGISNYNGNVLDVDYMLPFTVPSKATGITYTAINIYNCRGAGEEISTSGATITLGILKPNVLRITLSKTAAFLKPMQMYCIVLGNDVTITI